ncbi:histidine--tRNA ligase [Patescibacteria group bacterium]|nr:histidine--tRNA ligase [Patescibacteria group bacterium]MCL5010084.1 histidine--tRNA ligase [Patescibacteria group bacterium]
MNKPQTLKGFRDFLPKEAGKRQYVIEVLQKVFESYGFEPLETPALEYEEILMGKYGEEGDKLMYRFADNGGRRVALRYDQTVPLARVVAQYQNKLAMPFKRYQIQNVWRAENTQKGRYREFLQCDIDIVGTNSPLADAEIIQVAENSLLKLGFKTFKIIINDRQVFRDLIKGGFLEENQLFSAVRSIDKIKKIGRSKVIEELAKIGIDKNTRNLILQHLENRLPPKSLMDIFLTLRQTAKQYNLPQFSPTLARGLDYYTGMIFEIEINGYTGGSVCGGGRYDNLIGMFAGKDIPAVGCAFGFDRIIEAMEELNLFPANLRKTKVLVTVFSKELMAQSLGTASMLRNALVEAEIFLGEDVPLEKQFKYANQKEIPYLVMIGPEEAKKNQVALKNMKTGRQETLSKNQLAERLSSEPF